jgi:hypothetical protein
MIMTNTQYLQSVLDAQILSDDSAEMKALRAHRAGVEKVLREAFGAVPTIRYGGSKAKGTLIHESYDLDVVCYFPNGDTSAGTTLRDVFNSVLGVLHEKFHAIPKTSAIRLHGRDPSDLDFHIDVVPGRFSDETKTDCYLYQNGAEKERLKTNLDTHIEFIRDAGVTPALRLLKLWRVRKGLSIKNFVWELLCIRLLAAVKNKSLEEQVYYVLETIADTQDAIKVEDPANPQGNELMTFLRGQWQNLRASASQTLQQVDRGGWTPVYGDVVSATAGTAADRLQAAVATVSAPNKPWSGG